MVDKLMTDGFARNGPAASATTDPLVDTPMVLTLDQLRPYDHDPRLTRNPLYEEIKASIRERNLDSPPAVTRRPGETTYIIRNGGNTRLAVLRELWAETRDERFFRILCLFRPWSPRGEIVALTGHLAENELHGGLSFIERALGVEKARELYEQETGQTLSQSELARRLTADGFPIKQPHISRMQEAVQHLLPAIPNALYGGLGRKQVERLSFLRRACERVWDQRCTRGLDEFQELFQDVVSAFDGAAEAFSYERVQDELVGRISEELAIDYDVLCLEVLTDETRHEALSNPQPPVAREPVVAVQHSPTPAASPPVAVPSTQLGRPLPGTPAPREESPTGDSAAQPLGPSPPAPDRLQAIRGLVVDSLDEASDAEPDTTRFPVGVDGLYPISDIWSIDVSIDAPEHLRVHLGQLAREVAAETGCVDQVQDTDNGLGFRCVAEPTAAALPRGSAALLSLLEALSSSDGSSLGAFLVGDCHRGSPDRLSDAALLKLFRLIRLARRLVDQDQAALASIEP
nr:ParB family protein [uncultured Caldimonas sp.]